MYFSVAIMTRFPLQQVQRGNAVSQRDMYTKYGSITMLTKCP